MPPVHDHELAEGRAWGRHRENTRPSGLDLLDEGDPVIILSEIPAREQLLEFEKGNCEESRLPTADLGS